MSASSSSLSSPSPSTPAPSNCPSLPSTMANMEQEFFRYMQLVQEEKDSVRPHRRPHHSDRRLEDQVFEDRRHAPQYTRQYDSQGNNKIELITLHYFRIPQGITTSPIEFCHFFPIRPYFPNLCDLFSNSLYYLRELETGRKRTRMEDKQSKRRTDYTPGLPSPEFSLPTGKKPPGHQRDRYPLSQGVTHRS